MKKLETKEALAIIVSILAIAVVIIDVFLKPKQKS